MKRKLMSMLFVFVLLTSLSPAVAADAVSAQPTVKENAAEYHGTSVEVQSANTLTDIVATDEEVVVYDLARNQRIDYLFYLRGQLESNYDENLDEILRIDQELQELGVETLTNEEVMSKMGNTALPMVEFMPSTLTNWTSRRVIVTYAGQHFELQIIEGVPTSVSSSLWETNGIISHTAEGFLAGALNIFDGKLQSAVGSVPIVGDVVTVYSAFSEIAEIYNDAYSETTVVDSATGVALMDIKTHMKFIYVKGYGSSDNLQLLSYLGNSVYYKITSTTSQPFLFNGELYSEQVTETYEATVESDYYTDYSIPVRTYYQLRNNVYPSVTIDYSFKTLEITILGQSEEREVPYEMVQIINQ